MSSSASAIVFYGLPLGCEDDEGFPEEWKDGELDSIVDSLKGVELVYHGNLVIGPGAYVLAARGSSFVADEYDGEPETLDLTIDPRWDEDLRAACGALGNGLKPEFGWRLAASYG